MTVNRTTPRDLGLIFGNTWAKTADRLELAAFIEEHTVPDQPWETIMAAGRMRERLEEFPDPRTAHEKFLEGFYHGVRAFVVEELKGTSSLS
jgi:hypothetical protein